ncbi:MAG: hypothetical protein AAGJ10_14695 [Bacteroidota bacterium]
MSSLRQVFASVLLAVSLLGLVGAPALHWASHADHGHEAHEAGHEGEPHDHGHADECPDCAYLQTFSGFAPVPPALHAAGVLPVPPYALPRTLMSQAAVQAPHQRGPPAVV